MWLKSVLFTNREQRGYKVALAFQFEGGHVLAFLSHDLLFRMQWLPPPDASVPLGLDDPLRTIDVFENFDDFLRALAGWLSDRRSSATDRSKKLACEVMRTEAGAKRVWVGVGVYTVCELFFIAGISVFLSEKEVFDNASRTARLANAFWQFAYNAQDVYMKCISPSLVDNVLAPTKEQRRYYLKYLYVFRKDRTKLPTRMATAIDAFEARLLKLGEGTTVWRRDDMTNELYDYFEPSLMENALLLRTCHRNVDVTTRDRKPMTADHECRKCVRVPCDKARKEFSLGGLCMGFKYWRRLAPPAVLALEEKYFGLFDPLTRSFNQAYLEGIITWQDRFVTFLRPDFYAGGIVPQDVPYSERPVRFPLLYTLHETTTKNTTLYSMVYDYPVNSTPDQVHAEKKISKRVGGKVTLASYNKTVAASFVSIIKSDGLVAIGPLEYCGNGIPLTHGCQTFVSLVRDGDPRLPKHLFLRATMTQTATRVLSAVRKARVARAEKAARTKAMLTMKAKAGIVTVARDKERLRVRKEADAKVLTVKGLVKHLKAAYKEAGHTWVGRAAPLLPSQAAQMAAIPDLPTPTPSRCSSLGPGDDYDFDFSSPPPSPSAISREPVPTPPPSLPPSPPKPKKQRFNFDKRLATETPSHTERVLRTRTPKNVA